MISAEIAIISGDQRCWQHVDPGSICVLFVVFIFIIHEYTPRSSLYAPNNALGRHLDACRWLCVNDLQKDSIALLVLLSLDNKSSAFTRMPKSPSTLQFHCTQSTVHKHTRILWYNGPMGSVADHARITESSPSNQSLAITKGFVGSSFTSVKIIRLFYFNHLYLAPFYTFFSFLEAE